MIIAAKTGQGKTLTFGLPILEMLVKRVQRVRAQRQRDEESVEEDQEKKKEEEPIFDLARALIISPTRELALQIRDMI